MKHIKAACCVFFFIASTHAEAMVEVGIFAPQRNVFVYAAEDTTRGGLSSEILGKRSGDVGLAREFGPVGFELHWYKNAFAGNGPLARLRVAPWAVQLRAGQEMEKGWDGQLQLGHSWTAASLGSLGITFELGATFRRFMANDSNAIPLTSFAGGFWSMIANYQQWNFEVEASLLALSLGEHGKWGLHRDSNALRLRLSRSLGEQSPWRVWGEFFHVHRTFTKSEFGFSNALFVSDVTVALGLTRAL